MGVSGTVFREEFRETGFGGARASSCMRRQNCKGNRLPKTNDRHDVYYDLDPRALGDDIREQGFFPPPYVHLVSQKYPYAYLVTCVCVLNLFLGAVCATMGTARRLCRCQDNINRGAIVQINMRCELEARAQIII